MLKLNDDELKKLQNEFEIICNEFNDSNENDEKTRRKIAKKMIEISAKIHETKEWLEIIE